jgi:hypothetical protein
MNAWHKAMENVWRCVTASVTIYCTGCDGCHHEEQSMDCPTKMEAIKNAKAKGWTYDKEGNWLCPACSKENDMGNIRTALRYLKSILKMTNNGTDLSAQSEGDLKMAIQILEDVLQKNRGGDQ